MRQIDKTKLYAGMTLKERAKLAFKFTTSNDATGLDNILATIPKKTYVSNDLGFSMRTTGLYQTAILWGFEYQKQQGLNTTFLGMLGSIDENIKDPKLKQTRIEAEIKFRHSCDKLEILFSLLDELDKSHGLDRESVYAIAEVRCIAVGSSILDIEEEIPMRAPQVLINHETKNKSQACKDYYLQTKKLLLTMLNQYDKAMRNYSEVDLEKENETLKAKLKRLETRH